MYVYIWYALSVEIVQELFNSNQISVNEWSNCRFNKSNNWRINVIYLSFYVFKAFYFSCQPINILSMFYFKIYIIIFGRFLRAVIDNLQRILLRYFKKTYTCFQLASFQKQFQNVLKLVAPEHSLVIT